MCDKIGDEYIDFLENYLSDVLTGQIYQKMCDELLDVSKL